MSKTMYGCNKTSTIQVRLDDETNEWLDEMVQALRLHSKSEFVRGIIVSTMLSYSNITRSENDELLDN